MSGFFVTAFSTILPAVLLIGGCAAKPLDRSPFFEILDFSVPESPVTADLFLLNNLTPRKYLVIGTNEEPREISQSQEATERFKSEWKVIDGDDRERFFRQDAAGDILLTAVIEHDENAISLFNPPLIAAYHRLKPGETRTQVVAMKVVNENNPSRLRESGTATQTITYLDDCQVRLPWGTFTARRLSVTFAADLKLAQVRVETILYVACGYGVLIEETQKTIRILGIFPQHESSIRVLIGPAMSAPPL